MSDDEPLREYLLENIKGFGLKVTKKQQDLLLEYFSLLQKWNKVYNLVAPGKAKELFFRHFIDSLSVCSQIDSLPAKVIVDVGCGAGFPGLVLAVLQQNRKFILLDSSKKKTTFVQTVIRQLRLGNAEVVCSKAQGYIPSPKADVVISRAVADIDRVITISEHLCHENGLFVLMKGKLSKARQEKVPKGFRIVNMQDIKLPAECERCLVVVGKC